ncbi:putative C6 finger domain protein [Stachybotrys elegans]|uniref:C6 finger domain protein n=1 Tax=Stachybotrys elegans TaxID=80388 RepID=A0A8K0SHT0_9HYPO|nr:putative C6 finger domain protein [Stachybotrys elegans]
MIGKHQDNTGPKQVAILDRLERTVALLVDRLDSRLDDVGNSTREPVAPRNESQSSPDLDPAPVFLIRDAATNAGVHSPEQTTSGPDVISSGLVSLPTAHALLDLFHFHYGRWVRFSEDMSRDALFLHVRRSPMLLCSVLLIAVRHTTQELADRLAPNLFRESKRLVTASLLEVPQSIEFFQTCLILSLWSTTIGQVPLSIDSWLLTGYAIQQALASPHFAEVSRPSSNVSTSHLDLWFLWNHLCVAHLQYCVGTRRHALLNQTQIDRCVTFIKSNDVTNYETRMGAEINLYWIIYTRCNGPHINLSETKNAFQSWQREWSSLFYQPRSQFLQMGFHFAYLLAYCQSLKSPKSVMHSSVLKEMIQHCKSIINLAIDTTDERTRHLTDHIYHIITFSALTLCRIVHTYESKLRSANHNVADIDALIFRLINWFRSIGLPCHVAHILGDILSAQFQKLRPAFQPTVATATSSMVQDSEVMSSNEDLFLPTDLSFYPNFIEAELFGIDMGVQNWPEWGPIHSDTDGSV